MRVKEATLRAYLDGELSPAEQKRVEQHLATSAEARRTLGRLRQQMERVAAPLELLAPPTGAFTPAEAALRRLKTQRTLASTQDPSFTVWESPTLLVELKALVCRRHPSQSKSKGAFYVSRNLLWLTSIVLIAAAVAAGMMLRPDLGRRLAESAGQLASVAVERAHTSPGKSEPIVQLPDDVTPVSAVFEDKIELVGYRLAAGPVVPGELLELTLYWRMLQLPDVAEAMFVHVLDQAGQVVIGEDRPFPGQSGPLIEDAHRLSLPEKSLAPGRYELVVGLYNSATGRRLTVYQAGVLLPEAAVRLTPMTVGDSQDVLTTFELKSVRQLTPCENKGRRLLRVQVQDVAGQGLNDVPVRVQWQAEPAEFTVVRTGRLNGEPGWLEFAMAEDSSYTVQVWSGSSHVTSDLTTRYGQVEPCNGSPGNDLNRVSYEIIFQQAESEVATASGFGYGIQVDPHGDTAANIGHVQKLGFGWVKLRLPWKEIEPEQGQYAWEPWDEVIGAYAASNVKVLLNVIHAPDWARPEDDDRSVEGVPADPATYAELLAQIAGRYRGKVQAIEVWNEQNVWYKVGGRGRMNAAEYVSLLQAAYQAVKAVNPELIVISGGLSPAGKVGDLAMDDVDYLRQMYEHGLKDSVDAIGAKPLGYHCPALADWQTVTPEEATADPDHGLFRNRHHSWCFLGTLEGYREVILANDDSSTPVWVTEFGWGVADEKRPGYEFAADNTSEEQAQWIVEAYQWGQTQDWVGPMFLWNLDYSLTAPGTELGFYSILDMPAYEALRELDK
jgi:anti-sigma factor RsiW